MMKKLRQTITQLYLKVRSGKSLNYEDTYIDESKVDLVSQLTFIQKSLESFDEIREYIV